MLQGTIHRRGNFFGGLRPDVDDLVVTLSIRDRSHPILFFHLAYGTTSLLDHRRFFFRNDHVVDSNRNTCTSGRFETQILQLIETNDCGRMTALLVTAENDFPQLLFPCGFVDKAQFLWPDAIELHPTRGRFDEFFRSITKDGL